jgi:hypothetical protein
MAEASHTLGGGGEEGTREEGNRAGGVSANHRCSQYNYRFSFRFRVLGALVSSRPRKRFRVLGVLFTSRVRKLSFIFWQKTVSSLPQRVRSSDDIVCVCVCVCVCVWLCVCVCVERQREREMCRKASDGSFKLSLESAPVKNLTLEEVHHGPNAQRLAYLFQRVISEAILLHQGRSSVRSGLSLVWIRKGAGLSVHRD